MNFLISDFRSVKCYTDDDVFNGYACHNSDVCVPLDWVCDGEGDCIGNFRAEILIFLILPEKIWKVNIAKKFPKFFQCLFFSKSG